MRSELPLPRSRVEGVAPAVAEQADTTHVLFAEFRVQDLADLIPVGRGISDAANQNGSIRNNQRIWFAGGDGGAHDFRGLDQVDNVVRHANLILTCLR